jgi:hypothetical protein
MNFQKLIIVMMAGFLTTGCIMIRYEKTGLPLVSEERTVEEYDQIILEDNVDLSVRAGEEYSMKLRLPEGYSHRVTTKVIGGSLVIDQLDMNLTPEEIIIDITLPKLTAFEMKSHGEVELLNLDADFFEVTLEGAGSIKAEGTCGRLTITIDGIGNLEARRFKCEHVKLEFDGIGSAEVYANQSIDADVSGIGSIDVYGGPSSVKKDVSGIGSFDIHGRSKRKNKNRD